MSLSIDQWVNRDAANYVNLISAQIGSPVVWNRSGGAAIWIMPEATTLTSSSPSDLDFIGTGLPSSFAKHMALDESVKHLCPTPHTDFFYSFVNALLTPDQLDLVNRASASAGYDKLKNTLYVRCDCIESNIIMLRILFDLILGKISLKKLYRSDINKTLARYKDHAYVKLQYQILYDNIIQHYQQAADKGLDFDAGYWQGSSNESCGPPVVPGFFGWFVASKPAKSSKLRDKILRMRQSQTKVKPILVNPTKISKERFKSHRSENLLSEDSWLQDPYYTSNNAYILREGWDEDSGPYAPLTNDAREHMVDPNGVEYDNDTFVPTYRDALLAQGEYTYSGLRELFTSSLDYPNLKTNPSRSFKSRCRCTGSRCACKKRNSTEQFLSGRENLESSTASYNTDPRFLGGTSELHFNVGSDVNDITRSYGTVDQKRHYPKLTDYVNYGISSVLEPPN